MREPPRNVRIFGHPVVAIPVFGICGVALYAWTQNAEAGFLGICALAVGGFTIRATDIMKRHREWAQAWDSMAGPPLPKRPAQWRPWLGALLAVSVAVYCFGKLDQPGYNVAFSCMVLVLIAAAFAAVARRLLAGRAKRPKPDKRDIVTVAVARPILPVSGLVAAYDALPAYCWQAIEATRK